MGNLEHLAKKIISATRSVTGAGDHPLHIPDLTGQERALVSASIDEGYVSSVGAKVTEFERLLQDYTGAKHAIAVSSGTAALHIALLAVGVEAGDEVLVPALTFAASANAVLYCGATPHFIESSAHGFGVDAKALSDYLDNIVAFNDLGEAVNKKTGRIIRGLMVVHIFGHIGDSAALKAVAARYNLTLIEDAAEALGSWANNIHAGLHGHIGILSFNGNKTITTGGGGCVLTDDKNLADLTRHLSTTAKVPHAYEYYHDRLGYNYRMPNLNAALGIGQMLRLKQFLAEKITLRDAYQSAFSDIDGCAFYIHEGEATSNYWLQTIILDEESIISNEECARNHILEMAHADGLMMRPIWQALHTLPHFSACPSMDLPMATSLANRVINIPSSCYLGRAHD